MCADRGSDLAEKVQAVGCGGIGAIHLLAQRIGLVDALNQKVQVLKRHLPYHESDHVLNLAYNIMAGGERLEDIELRRQDECFLNGLGAPRIPDPTTAGDFTRRFNPDQILDLMEAINQGRQRVWQEQPEGFLDQAVIDVDGTIAPTLGECKGEMDISYKGIWGYCGIHGLSSFCIEYNPPQYLWELLIYRYPDLMTTIGAPSPMISSGRLR